MEGKSHENETAHGGAENAPASLTTNPTEEGPVAPNKPTTAPAFQFYPKDFLSSSKVQRMSLTEVGAYTILLSHCWLDNGLPTEVGQLARIVKVPERQFAKMWAGPLSECFYEKKGRLQNSRLDVEREKQSDYRRRQSDRATKRWDSRKHAAPGNATAMPRHSHGTAKETQCRDDALQSPISNLQSPVPRPTDAVARARGAPLHDTSHRKHAACGRVCLPSSLFDEFVRRRGTPDAEREVDGWATGVLNDWREDGPKSGVEPGDPLDFWRAQYASKWPAARVQSAVESKLPEWARKVRERKAAES